MRLFKSHQDHEEVVFVSKGEKKLKASYSVDKNSFLHSKIECEKPLVHLTMKMHVFFSGEIYQIGEGGRSVGKVFSDIKSFVSGAPKIEIDVSDEMDPLLLALASSLLLESKNTFHV